MNRRFLVLAVAAAAGISGSGAGFAQQVEPPPLPRGDPPAPPIKPEIVIEPAPSFSNIRLKLSRARTHANVEKGVAVGETAELQLLQPFKSSPYGAHVAEQGLGSVRSAQVTLSLWQTALLRPDEPVETRAHPVTGVVIHAAVGHRSFDGQAAGTGDDARVHHVPFSIGTVLEYRAGDPGSFLGRQKFGFGVEYRRQYVPADGTKAPIRLGSKLVRGSIEGAFGGVPLLANGLSYRLTGGYDISRDIPGAELTLSTALFDYPRLVVGVNFWIQGRDADERTRDKRFDIAPRLALQF